MACCDQLHMSDTLQSGKNVLDWSCLDQEHESRSGAPLLKFLISPKVYPVVFEDRTIMEQTSMCEMSTLRRTPSGFKKANERAWSRELLYIWHRSSPPRVYQGSRPKAPLLAIPADNVVLLLSQNEEYNGRIIEQEEKRRLVGLLEPNQTLPIRNVVWDGRLKL